MEYLDNVNAAIIKKSQSEFLKFMYECKIAVSGCQPLDQANQLELCVMATGV